VANYENPFVGTLRSLHVQHQSIAVDTQSLIDWSWNKGKTRW